MKVTVRTMDGYTYVVNDASAVDHNFDGDVRDGGFLEVMNEDENPLLSVPLGNVASVEYDHA